MLPNCVAYFFWIFIVHHVYSATDVLSCFEKTPDHALIGYAQDTGNNQVGSLEECLGQCLDAEKKFQFECKSALFYPDLKECNLNTATKVDDSFSFVETAVGEKVDYYQKTCGVENVGVQTTSQSSVSSSSPVGNNPCFQRFEGKSIQGVPDNIVQGTADVNQCQQECAGAVTKYQITCKSILWSEQQKGCILVEVSAGDVPNQVVDDAKIDYYEYLCGGNSATTTTPLPVTTPGFSITPSITQGPQPITGSGTGLRDPRISSCFQQLPTQSAMTEDRIFPVTSVDQCADTCLFCADCLMGQRCNMVAYAISNGHCALSRTTGQPSGLNELGSAGEQNILYYARGKC